MTSAFPPDNPAASQSGALKFMAIVNEPHTAALWVDAGVDTVMVDLETFQKAERQRGRDTVLSSHSIKDIGEMREALPTVDLVARCEPVVLPGWDDHIEAILEQQPTSVMLPMATSADDAHRLVQRLDGRAKAIVMIETKSALEDAAGIAEAVAGGVVFVGLNDLHIQLEHSFMFEPLALGMIDDVAETAKKSGAAFGFGGLARLGEGLLNSEVVLREHVRLGSQLVILSRTFFQDIGHDGSISTVRAEIAKLREAEIRAARRSAGDSERDRLDMITQISGLARKIRN